MPVNVKISFPSHLETLLEALLMAELERNSCIDPKLYRAIGRLEESTEILEAAIKKFNGSKI